MRILKCQNHKDEILEDYACHKTIKEICVKYGVSNKTIRKFLRLNNIKIRHGHKYNLNHGFFKKINEASAYFLGLLYADGNMSKSVKSISINLKKEDSYMLEVMRKYIQYTGPLFCKGFKDTNIKRQDQVCLKINSEELYEDLKKMGLYPDKSLTISFPEIDVDNLRHFMRGYLDGDGCIRFKERSYHQVIICCSNNFAKGLKVILNNMGIKCGIYISGKIRNLSLSNRGDVIKFLDWIYFDCNPELFFKRKHEIYERMKAYNPLSSGPKSR